MTCAQHESDLRASQDRVKELEAENASLRADLVQRASFVTVGSPNACSCGRFILEGKVANGFVIVDTDGKPTGETHYRDRCATPDKPDARQPDQPVGPGWTR